MGDTLEPVRSLDLCTIAEFGRSVGAWRTSLSV